MDYSYGIRLVISILLLALIVDLELSYITIYSQPQQGLEGSRLEPSNIYRVSYAELSISAIAASAAAGAGVVGVAGQSASGGYVFEAIHIDRGSKTFNRYPYMLSGKPTSISSDGDYGGYIAVGGERGEVLVYSISDRRVSYIQASRYPIKSLAIGVGRTGDPYLAALDSGGYLYMYRATRGGWGEIGPKISTAIYNHTVGRVLDIAPVEVVVEGSMRVDPSLILIIYSPPSIGAIFRIVNESGYPIANATITANLTYPPPSRQIVVQALTAGDGVARLDLPIIDPSNTTYNIRITHQEYSSESLGIAVRYVEGRFAASVEYRGATREYWDSDTIQIIITMMRGTGELTPILPTLNVTLASLIDIEGAPEEIRIGKPVPLFINPIALKLVKPASIATPWAYMGIVVGCCVQGSPASLFLYYDQSLNIVPAGGMDYRWYILPEGLDRAWIGYDDNGLGLLVVLSSGKAYYFLYDRSRDYHVAFWGLDMPSRISTSFYRNGALLALGDGGYLYIQRVSPPSSMPCARSGDYLGIPLGPGVGSSISPGGEGYIVTSDRVYIAWGLSSIIAGRCPLDLVRISASISIADLVSSYLRSIPEGYVDIYEGGDLVARSMILNGSSKLYLPAGDYEAVVRGGAFEYRYSVSLPHSTLDLRSPTMYRVNISIYIYSPETPYMAVLQRPPPGLTLVIDNKTSLSIGDGPVEVLLPGGIHRAALTWMGLVLARGLFNVSSPGPIDLVLTANIAILNTSISVLGGTAQPLPIESIRVRLFGEGPLLTGDLGFIRPGEELKLPLGIYRIVVESPFFYTSESIAALREPGEVVNIAVSLRPKEIPLRLVVADDFGYPVANASISIIRSGSPVKVFTGLTSDDGSALIPRITFGDYLVSVEPANKSLYTSYNGILRIDRQEVVLRINRTLQPVSIQLIDPISSRPIAPLRITIYVEDRPLYSVDINASARLVNTSIPFGNARIVVEPLQQSQQIYSRVEVSKRIEPGGARLEITLVRRIHEITLKIVNDLGQPVERATVVMKSIENPSIEITAISDETGSIPMKLPYSVYILEVTAQGYNKLETTLTLDKSIATLQLNPTIISLLQRYTVAYIAAGMTIAIILVARYLSSYIERKMREEAV